MKLFTQLFLFFSLMMTTFSIQAQQSRKIDSALSGFLKTEFMLKFQDLKTEAEGLATAFKSEENKYSVQDRTRVSTAYDKTARRFNAVLIDIKTDFLNKEKIKVISKFPDMYADGLRADMRDLSDYYAQNFQQALSDVTQDEVDGSAVILLLIELVKLSSEGINGLVQMRKNAKKYDDTYLTKHLVRPNQFRYWEQLGSSNYNDGYNDTYDDTNNQDTYDQETYNEDTYNQDNNNEGTYNEDTYNDNSTNDNTYNEENYNNSNNNLNQNNANDTRYDDIENFKFKKKVNKNNNTSPKTKRYQTTNKKKIQTPTKKNKEVVNPRMKAPQKNE